MMFGIQDFDLIRKLLNIAGFEFFRSLDIDKKTSRSTLLGADTNAFEIQNDLRNVFGNSFNGRKLMLDTFDPQTRKGTAGNRRKKDAPN